MRSQFSCHFEPCQNLWLHSFRPRNLNPIPATRTNGRKRMTNLLERHQRRSGLWRFLREILGRLHGKNDEGVVSGSEGREVGGECGGGRQRWVR